ncbi:MAG: hypothetical protein ACUVXD_17700 [Thermodesulfobacteriota bacterium]
MDVEIAPCEIWVDVNGCWYYRGAEIVHRDIVELFYEHLEQDERGRYVIHWLGQRCYIEVEDTPFVVWEISTVEGENDTAGILLHLSDGKQEKMDPSSFWIGPGNVPYCRIRNGAFAARFSRKAYYQLVRHVEEDAEKGVFYLRIGEERYPISNSSGQK